MIEYLEGNGLKGAAWNPYTGCLHGLAECPTAPICWARNMSHRLPLTCGGDFQPRYHLGRLEQPLEWRKPRRVAGCFMGELFGDWQQVDAIGSLGGSLYYKAWVMEEVQRQILVIVGKCPRHQFLFLTKRPENLARWNPWPKNAWVGCSITGAETAERQEAMIKALGQVEGGKRWISYEPLLAAPYRGPPEWLDWAVIGAQSGKGAVAPEGWWVEDLERAADLYRIPYWRKNNLVRALGLEKRQELPDDS